MDRAKHGQKPPWPAAVLALLSLAGCSRSTVPTYPGDAYPGAASSAGPASPAGSVSKEPALQRWDLYEEVQRWPRANEKPFLSLGHLSARYTAVVHVDAAAREAYSNLVAGSNLPVGTVIAEIHRDPRTEKNGPLFAMRKLDANRWEYFVVDGEGRLRERGNLPLCQRCHVEGVADHLFGLPRNAN
jgi:hypothetical protein